MPKWRLDLRKLSNLGRACIRPPSSEQYPLLKLAARDKPSQAEAGVLASSGS